MAVDIAHTDVGLLRARYAAVRQPVRSICGGAALLRGAELDASGSVVVSPDADDVSQMNS